MCSLLGFAPALGGKIVGFFLDDSNLEADVLLLVLLPGPTSWRLSVFSLYLCSFPEVWFGPGYVYTVSMNWMVATSLFLLFWMPNRTVRLVVRAAAVSLMSLYILAEHLKRIF